MDKSLSIYVHIPFCVRKCNYCDFLSFYAEKDMVEAYFVALKKEIALAAKDLNGSISGFRRADGDQGSFLREDRLAVDGAGQAEDGSPVVRSVFFGGGTPSFVDAQLICDTLAAINSSFAVDKDAEISIEVNPASAMHDKLVAYRQAGFNRISIGAQSLNDDELKCLGRAHDSAMFYETFENARKSGFTNINVDVMSALPGQSLDSYLATLRKVVALKPEHISAYSLILEEGTPFYDMELDLPDEDLDRAMYHETKRLLAQAGYHRYEISNYALGKADAKRSYECYHNKVYWQRGNYLGIGIGAASMVDNCRWSNTRDVRAYVEALTTAGYYMDALESEELSGVKEASHINGSVCVNDSACMNDSIDVSKEINSLAGPDTLASIRREYEELTVDSQMEEFMFLGLRLVEGVSVAEFKRLFGRDIWEVYGEVIDKYIGLGLLEYVETDSAKDKVDKVYHFSDGTMDGDVFYNLVSVNQRLRLTDAGLDVSNTVMAEFLL